MPQDPEAADPRPALPMRLTRLRVKNFRSIADIDIPLSPLTVLVGPNGSGKSNVVDALRFVRDVFARGLDQAVMDREGMSVIQRWGTEGEGITIGVTMEWSIKENDLKFTDEQGRLQLVHIGKDKAELSYDFTILTQNSAPIVAEETLIVSLANEEWKRIKIRKTNFLEVFINNFSFQKAHGLIEELWPSSRVSQWLPVGLMQYIKKYHYDGADLGVHPRFIPFQHKAYHFDELLTKQLFYDFDSAAIRQPQQVVRHTPFDEKGRNLAAVLQNLSATNDTGIGVQFALQQTIAGFSGFEIEHIGGYLATKFIYQTDTTEPRTSYIGQESDGTIRMLGILAALYQDPPQPFLSIEEPEANIHPGALAVLASVLDEASLRSQILVTTHSPDMLDHLPAQSFLVVEKVGDTTHVGPLDASQLASVRKRLFTPGELLRMEGLQRQTTPDSAA